MIRTTLRERFAMVYFPAVFSKRSVRAIPDQVAKFISAPHIRISSPNGGRPVPRGIAITLGYARGKPSA